MHHKFIDQFSLLDSFLHRLDPRVKIAVFAGIVLFVVASPSSSFAGLGGYALMIGGLAASSKVPWKFIFARSLSVVPFAALVAVSLTFGRGHDRWPFFFCLLAKSYLSVAAMVLLVATTSFGDLLKALEKLKAPRIFLMVFSFLYRYVYLFTDELMRMNQARRSRTIRPSRWLHLKTLANMVGNLFIRSYERGEDVYLAMCSRGYDGTVRSLYRFSLKARDFAFLAGVFLYLVLVRSYA